jgi:hypothetical protein
VTSDCWITFGQVIEEKLPLQGFFSIGKSKVQKELLACIAYSAGPFALEPDGSPGFSRSWWLCPVLAVHGHTDVVTRF